MEPVSILKKMKAHDVESVDFREDTLLLTVDGQRLEVPLELISESLRKAESWQRQLYEVSPSGYGIHWSVLDEDLSIDGLLRTHQELRTTAQ